MKRQSRGFTLVEMVVVIGIIVLLAALTFAVGVAVVQNSEVRQTESTIKLLDAAVKEWEAQADRKVSYGEADQPVNGAAYDIELPDATVNAADITKEFFAIIARTASVKQILAQVDPQFVKRQEIDPHNTGLVETFEFRDAWGNLIVAILPGRPWVSTDANAMPSYVRDDDGTVRTEIEKTRGQTANRQVCFVSAGPDGNYGNLVTDLDPARDNVYSYPATAAP